MSSARQSPLLGPVTEDILTILLVLLSAAVSAFIISRWALRRKKKQRRRRSSKDRFRALRSVFGKGREHSRRHHGRSRRRSASISLAAVSAEAEARVAQLWETQPESDAVTGHQTSEGIATS
jgi:hypothetical protein